ncbi:MAG: KEOPS complex N(6)-L-threonylcarbamoyladenine synthase Kae1 [Candidatus Woesearchaeota archaeon]
MLCLAIESTAHTFAASVVKKSSSGLVSVLSSVRDMFTTEGGGLIPRELADHHVLVWREVVSSALAEAGVSLSSIGLLAYSRAPGFGHALRVGSGVVRCLASRYGLPVVGVNHCVAHLEVGRVLGGVADPVLLYASGANTQVIALEGGRYRVFGETLDLGVGNFLDSLARSMGLGFPGGPALEKLAASYRGSLVELPYVVKGMDVSFSGIQSAVRLLLKRGVSSEAIAFSVQEHVFAMLVEVSERALAHTGKSSLVLGGGVACNARLQEMCSLMCSSRGVSFFAPEKRFLVDNAAMIGVLGFSVFDRFGSVCVSEVDFDPYERTDEAVVALWDV